MKNIPTKALVEELASRHGIELHNASLYGTLRIRRRYDICRGEINCPYVLLITQDAYEGTPDSFSKPDAERG